MILMSDSAEQCSALKETRSRGGNRRVARGWGGGGVEGKVGLGGGRKGWVGGSGGGGDSGGRKDRSAEMERAPRLQGRLTVPDNLASIPSHCYTDGSRVLRKAASDAQNTRQRESERGNETDKAKQR